MLVDVHPLIHLEFHGVGSALTPESKPTLGIPGASAIDTAMVFGSFDMAVREIKGDGDPIIDDGR